MGSLHTFTLGLHTCTIRVRLNEQSLELRRHQAITFAYDLFLDGRSPETGEELDPAAEEARWGQFRKTAQLNWRLVIWGLGAMGAAVGLAASGARWFPKPDKQ